MTSLPPTYQILMAAAEWRPGPPELPGDLCHCGHPRSLHQRSLDEHLDALSPRQLAKLLVPDTWE